MPRRISFRLAVFVSIMLVVIGVKIGKDSLASASAFKFEPRVEQAQ